MPTCQPETELADPMGLVASHRGPLDPVNLDFAHHNLLNLKALEECL